MTRELQSTEIYLASASPRRRELLTQIDVKFHLLPVNVPEEHQAGELPDAFVQRLALEKARAGWAMSQRTDNLPVLGADTIVVVNNEILGKPKNREQGHEMLGKLSGQCHQVLSAVALIQGDKEALKLSKSEVTFRDLSQSEIEAYWHTGEPWDKAGSYAIQGRAATFIERLEGSFSGVMGLPLFETAAALQEFQG